MKKINELMENISSSETNLGRIVAEVVFGVILSEG